MAIRFYLLVTLRRLFGGALFCLLALAAWAGDVHQGVVTCAGGTCHGMTKAFKDIPIRQDEYLTWLQKDAHARAYSTLLNERSRRIGRNLGITPEKDAGCLSCHADHPPVVERGERFQISDGVGCESCHGGSQRWLSEHARPGITLEEKIQLGMTPLWKPAVRAATCLQCHQGDAAHPITHAMMAAGHPPLLFELDTFSTLQPPHEERDEDYVRRKGAQDPARNWAVGQAVAGRSFLNGLQGKRLNQGLFPELMHFDCNACHHSLDAQRWTPGRSASLPPGAVPLADSHLYWLGVWMEIVSPDLHTRWQPLWRAVQVAQNQSAERLSSEAAAAARFIAREVIPAAEAKTLSKHQIQQLLKALSRTPTSPRARDFAAAEQAAMAAMVMTGGLEYRGVAVSKPLQQAIDRVYAAVRSRDQFRPAEYHAALTELGKALP